MKQSGARFFLSPDFGLRFSFSLTKMGFAKIRPWPQIFLGSFPFLQIFNFSQFSMTYEAKKTQRSMLQQILASKSSMSLYIFVRIYIEVWHKRYEWLFLNIYNLHLSLTRSNTK